MPRSHEEIICALPSFKRKELDDWYNHDDGESFAEWFDASESLECEIACKWLGEGWDESRPYPQAP